MNKVTGCVAAIATLIVAPAFAATAPTRAHASVYNWTGWYIGVNAGGSLGTVKTDINGAPIFGTTTSTVQLTPGFGLSDSLHPSGFIGGGQIGYNWQYSPLIVVGFEADIQGPLERDTNNNLSSQFNFGTLSTLGAGCGAATGQTTSPCAVAASYQTQIDWFGTVRARLGYVWGDGEVMSYLTGGLAYGEVKVSGTNTVSGLACAFGGCGGFSFSQIFGQSHVNTGWVLGYGTEGHLPLMPGNWTWKAEALYMDLGTLDTRSVTSANSDPTFFSGGQVTTQSHFTDWILRGGLNYRF